MRSRLDDFQAEVRNHSFTIEDFDSGDVDSEFSALHSIAELLSGERRTRFFEIANKFANARDDDNHLQML